MSFARSWLQILRQRNFALFVATNFLQIFDVTVASAFFVIFERHLLGDGGLSAEARGVIQGSAFVLPQVICLATAPLLQRYGSGRLITWSFYAKVGMALSMLWLGRDAAGALPLFMVFNRALPEATFTYDDGACSGYCFAEPLSPPPALAALLTRSSQHHAQVVQPPSVAHYRRRR